MDGQVKISSCLEATLRKTCDDAQTSEEIHEES